MCSSSRHVKTLESRSQLLDAALASADEANRRWEECRALVDQLRVENASLRAALQQAQMNAAAVSASHNSNASATVNGKNDINEGSLGTDAATAAAHSRQPSLGAGGVEVSASS